MTSFSAWKAIHISCFADWAKTDSQGSIIFWQQLQILLRSQAHATLPTKSPAGIHNPFFNLSCPRINDGYNSKQIQECPCFSYIRLESSQIYRSLHRNKSIDQNGCSALHVSGKYRQNEYDHRTSDWLSLYHLNLMQHYRSQYSNKQGNHKLWLYNNFIK